MKSFTIAAFFIFTTGLLIAQSSSQSFDAYINSPNDNVFETIAGATDGISKPNDLDFNMAETNDSKELWVINEGTENTGGSTVTILNAGESNQTEVYKKDGNSWHFMSLPTALAFGDHGEWANSPGILSANHNGSLFTGPSLWASDFSIYAITPPGKNGSHLDMLHQSPLSMGIAHEKDNVYWVNDGYHETIVMYDFAEDHGPGNSWHDDGRVHFYYEISLKRDATGIPGHMILDKATNWLYICDTGNKRIIRMEVGSADKKSDLPFNMELLAERWEMENVNWEIVVSTGLDKPCGIDVFGDRMVVTDNGTNEIIIYDISSNPISEVGRISVPHANANIRGVKVDPKGQIWFVDYNTNKVYKLDNQNVVGINEVGQQISFSVYPNPARAHLNVQLDGNAVISNIRIADTQGRNVMNNYDARNLINLDVSHLNSGMYIIYVQATDGQSFVQKFYKQ